MKSLESFYSCNTMNMIVELTNACNMRCKYCFENYQTVERSTVVMTKDILKNSIDFLIQGRDNCHLTFFGGEPTICKDLIIYAMEYGNQVAHENGKYISYSIVTNGTLLDEEFIDELNNNNVNIVFSFDGNEFSQNKFRPMANGDGSFSIVNENLKILLNKRKDERFGHLIIRPTITADTLPLLNTIYHNLVNMGCKEVSFSLVSAKEEHSYAINYDKLDSLRDAYSEMVDDYYAELQSGKSFNKFFEGILSRLTNRIASDKFCDCGKRYIAIDAKGDVYPCEGFMGVEEYKIGNIIDKNIDKFVVNPQKVDENDDCKNCWARHLCGGSCYHEAWMRTGSVDKRSPLVCETYRISFEVALKLFSRLQDEEFNFDIVIKQGLLPERSIPRIEEGKAKIISNSQVFVNDGMDFSIITLNETAFRIMELCDGETTLSEITEIIMSEYQCDEDIYEDICETICLLMKENIIRLIV